MDLEAVVVEASSAAAAAATSCTVAYPLDITKVRLQTGKARHGSFWGLLRSMLTNEGVGAFFMGWRAKMMETVLSTFSFFYWYALLKAVYKRNNWALGVGSNLALAAAAGSLNISFTLPFDVLTTRLQTQQVRAGHKRKTALEMAAQMLEEGGLLSFWRGYSVGVLLCCNPAINYSAFEAVKRYFEAWKLRSNPAAGKNGLPILDAFSLFVIGALAKAIATVVTYPLIRAKVLMTSSPARSRVVGAAPALLEAPAHRPHAESGEEGRGGKGQESAGHATPKPRGGGSGVEGRGLLGVLLYTLESEGVLGLYKGCKEQIGITVLKSAFLLMTKEYINAFTLSLIKVLRERRSLRIK